jgi:hypothetical protein
LGAVDDPQGLAMSEPIKTVVRSDGPINNVVQFEPMSIAAMVAVRCARVYVQTLLGLLSAGGLGLAPGWQAGELLSNVQGAALLSLAPVVFTFLQNTYELLQRIDESNPRWRA